MTTGQNSNSMAAGPPFVVGMWRSGTSLLYALLNQNPHVGLMYESDMLTLSPLFILPRKSSWWLNKVDSWNNALSRHKIDAAAIDPNITDLPNAFRAVAQQYAAAKGATVWGCKSPTYYDCMNQFAGCIRRRSSSSSGAIPPTCSAASFAPQKKPRGSPAPAWISAPCSATAA